ncbi:phosphoenolpyruvate carboxykinase (GTP) [Candidatus Woesearchaeota archaeon]|nr:phosphoenolpyruvate carboxykinase (GTP) [Candidatus Woesearchaeota archaeon]
MNISREILDEKNLKKLSEINNKFVLEIVEKYTRLCRPAKVTVITDSKEDISYVRNLALENKEEKKLAMEGHTVHYDGYYDQARDKANTKVLVSKGRKLSRVINTGERDECLKEVHEYLDGAMKGKEMLVRFFCLGPLNSKFSISALQLTDSAYVAHSEDILYRSGYEQFKKQDKSKRDFFYFVHSAGELNERGNSRNISRRRIYIDVEEEQVFTVNNQYAGNSLGLKKLALRLAISKASREDWLCEHMFIMGAKPEGKNRITYFTGAFPSACGKTSTAMIPGQTIVGDDIAYIRPGEDGKAYAANIEQGIFGIITDVNPVDDPIIYKVLTTPRELIFSNVLTLDGDPYWLNMGKELPKAGANHYGEWKEGTKDKDGSEVTAAHKNARYTVRISELDNADEKADDPEGVPINGFIYGGRDSDTSVPVFQTLGWPHGVFTGACLESETTSATLGKEGVRKLSPMANMDFLVVPLGVYIKNHLKFGEDLDKEPLVFATNYFLKKDGKFVNEKVDKKVWLMWMDGRIHNEYSAIETPIGYIPKYEDLKSLFKQVFGREYKKEDYEFQFSIRAERWLHKMDRIEEIYKAEEEIPKIFHDHIEAQRKRLKDAQQKYGKEDISPFDFE